MREDDGRKLDHRTLEVLRLRAVDQVQRGVPAAEVGAGLTAVGIHPKTIYTWLAKARAGGRQALRSRSAPGPRRKLSDQQLRELADLIITTDPRDHGLPVALWTREIVRQLIEARRSEEHTSELQSHSDLVCRLLLEKKKKTKNKIKKSKTKNKKRQI